MAGFKDYERINAREWDMNARENGAVPGSISQEAAPASEDGWEMVRGKKSEKSKYGVTAQNKQNSQPPKGKQTAHSVRSKQTSPQKKNWTNAKGHNIDVKHRPPPENLLVDIVTDACHAWRNRGTPTDHVRIPDELALQGQDQYEILAQQNGAFIHTDQVSGSGGSITFGIWGDKLAVRNAKTAILAWIKEWNEISGTRSNRSTKFAKVVSLTPKLRERKEREWLKEVQKQRYRQNPPPGSEFEAIGSFHWPSQEYRPEEILGASHEALDPIRADCACYVVFNKEKSTFHISGKAKDVQNGLLRLRKTCFQISARSIDLVREYLLHWPNAAVLPSQIHLEPYELINASPENKHGNMPLGQGKLDDETELEAQTQASEARMKRLLMQTVKRLHYYRGNIEISIRLGTFLAVQYRDTKDGYYDLGEYSDMIRESQFIGNVTEEIGDRTKETAILEAVQHAENLFLPNSVMATNLEAVRPLFAAIFTFADEAGDLCLTIVWKETEDSGASASEFEQFSKKWTRLDRDSHAATPLLDVSLSDLNTGMAWQFDVQACQALEKSRLPDRLAKFEDSIKIDSAIALDHASNGTINKPFVTYMPYAVNLKRVRQSLSYRYAIRSPDGPPTEYTLALTRFQDRAVPIRQTAPHSAAAEPVISKSRWSLSVFREEWGSMLAANENLKIGERAEWKDGIDDWFPNDPTKGEADEKSKSQGFEDLMNNLKKIGKLVKDLKGSDLMGEVDGITVG